MQITKNFVGSKMNKGVDERLLPKGQYVDGQNIRVSSDESGQAGSVENAKGNEILTALEYNGSPLSSAATCIGALEDGDTETIYWFVTDPGVVDLIVSYNTETEAITYHVVSTSVLNFSDESRINGVNLIDNLLFFTDNLNPPRRINVETSYPSPIAGVDQIDEDDISVIVKPPLSAPAITTVQNTTDENYMEDKFISFAYRYKYKDNEYSATSPFSNVAFTPSNFDLDYGALDNIGMLNFINQATISFDVGPANVIGVDVLFKETNSTVIKVIERFNKDDEGWADNSTQSVDFDNRKIYTTLTESELLRLYDNVPRLAKTQTTIGNRIMYGNYVDGYDVIDPSARNPIDYSLSLTSNSIGTGSLIDGTEDYTYSVDPVNNVTVSDAKITIDFSDLLPIQAGTTIYIATTLEHSQFSQDPGNTNVYPPGGAGTGENDFQVDFGFTVTRNFSDLATFYASPQFQNAIKGINPPRDPADCADGYSLTDLFNCSIATEVGWSLSDSTGFTTEISGNTIKIIPPVITYEDNANPGEFAYEYFYNLSSEIDYRIVTQNTSLHSDRDYEVGLVYMDDYGRASTVQVCDSNNIYIPKNTSDKQNTLQLSISNPAPSWATKYKPVIKESYALYETIYCKTFFKDGKSGTWFFKLEGDNSQKVLEGDFLVVKRDSKGVNYSQPRVKVLSIGVKQENFINPNDEDGPIEPTGVYMELPGNLFTVQLDPTALIWYGELNVKSDQSLSLGIPIERTGIPIDTTNTQVSYSKSGYYAIQDFTPIYGPKIAHPTYINTGTVSPTDPNVRNYVEYSIPVGTAVDFDIEYSRPGDSRFRWEFKRTFTATQEYSNFYDFILGENIDFTQPTNDPDAESQTNTPEAFWNPTIGTSRTGAVIPNPPQINALYFQYSRYVNNIDFSPPQTETYLGVSTQGGYYAGDDATLKMSIQVRRSEGAIVFETEPQETDGITYYENEQVFDIVSGDHQGNVQNQSTPGTPAIVDLSFFNCYSFGNGIESFKVRDNLAGAPLTVGTRAHAVANEEYKESRRFADITYSGVYNQETNINKLNEFNLALVNYKSLDQNFGPIEVMHARISDILVLQEDKISYVLANGKNLFSDATAGGSIISTPEVLGQQVPRIEQYGISNNPESFAAYGPDVFFTDAKRNAVINLKGGSASEQLNVISMLGLRSWFRDLFKDTRSGLKLGGFDPYSNEYVLSSVNDAGAARSSTDYTLSYSPSVQGWPSFYSFIPEQMIGMNSYFYSFDEGNLYRHNTNESRNNFYGVQYTSKITAVVNDAPSEVKVFKTISLESNSSWDATITSDLSSGYIDSTWFSLKDGDYFAYIRRTDDDNNLNLRSTQGVGQASTVDSGTITAIEIGFGFNIDSIASVGDKAYQIQGGGPVFIGDIVGISGSTITIDGTSGATTPIVGGYILYIKNNIAESYGASGYYMQYELESTSNSFVELFAVGTELFKSNP